MTNQQIGEAANTAIAKNTGKSGTVTSTKDVIVIDYGGFRSVTVLGESGRIALGVALSVDPAAYEKGLSGMVAVSPQERDLVGVIESITTRNITFYGLAPEEK